MITDIPFIFSTWLKGYYYGSKALKRIEKRAFMINYYQVIQKILSNPVTTVLVACSKEDPDVILGYSVAEPPTLHWVFVKKGFRKLGIAKAITPYEVLRVTHMTEIANEIKPNLVFDPFSII